MTRAIALRGWGAIPAGMGCTTVGKGGNGLYHGGRDTCNSTVGMGGDTHDTGCTTAGMVGRTGCPARRSPRAALRHPVTPPRVGPGHGAAEPSGDHAGPTAPRTAPCSPRASARRLKDHGGQTSPSPGSSTPKLLFLAPKQPTALPPVPISRLLVMNHGSRGPSRSPGIPPSISIPAGSCPRHPRCGQGGSADRVGVPVPGGRKPGRWGNGGISPSPTEAVWDHERGPGAAGAAKTPRVTAGAPTGCRDGDPSRRRWGKGNKKTPPSFPLHPPKEETSPNWGIKGFGAGAFVPSPGRHRGAQSTGSRWPQTQGGGLQGRGGEGGEHVSPHFPLHGPGLPQNAAATAAEKPLRSRPEPSETETRKHPPGPTPRHRPSSAWKEAAKAGARAKIRGPQHPPRVLATRGVGQSTRLRSRSGEGDAQPGSPRFPVIKAAER